MSIVIDIAKKHFYDRLEGGAGVVKGRCFMVLHLTVPDRVYHQKPPHFEYQETVERE